MLTSSKKKKKIETKTLIQVSNTQDFENNYFQHQKPFRAQRCTNAKQGLKKNTHTILHDRDSCGHPNTADKAQTSKSKVKTLRISKREVNTKRNH